MPSQSKGKSVKPALDEDQELSGIDWTTLFGHKRAFEQICKAATRGKLSPVLLLTGREGIGKRIFAARISAFGFCRDFGCGRCGVCQRVMARQHPDILWLEAESLQNEHAKLLQEHLLLQVNSGSETGFRTVVIVDVERLTQGALNRLLKVLEEPPDNTRIIMTSSRDAMLADTLRSRCSEWYLAPPSEDEVLNWARREHAAFTAGYDERALRDLYVRCGRSPGKLWRSLGQQQRLAELTATVDELSKPALWHDTSLLVDRLVKENGCTVAEFIYTLEWSINKQYRAALLQQHGQENPSSRLQDPRLLAQRRDLLWKLKKMALRSQTKINLQLAVEAWLVKHDAAGSGLRGKGQ